jgi:hypothetical protein
MLEGIDNDMPVLVWVSLMMGYNRMTFIRALQSMAESKPSTVKSCINMRAVTSYLAAHVKCLAIWTFPFEMFEKETKTTSSPYLGYTLALRAREIYLKKNGMSYDLEDDESDDLKKVADRLSLWNEVVGFFGENMKGKVRKIANLSEHSDYDGSFNYWCYSDATRQIRRWINDPSMAYVHKGIWDGVNAVLDQIDLSVKPVAKVGIEAFDGLFESSDTVHQEEAEVVKENMETSKSEPLSIRFMRSQLEFEAGLLFKEFDHLIRMRFMRLAYEHKGSISPEYLGKVFNELLSLYDVSVVVYDVVKDSVAV